MANQKEIQQFIKDFGPLANQIAQRTGQRPEFVLGQLANESDYGTHYINFNPFGIKKDGLLVRYKDMNEAAHAYVDLMNQPRYADVRNAKDLNEQAAAITRSGYAEEKDYGNRILGAVRQLQQNGYKIEDSPKPTQPASSQPAQPAQPVQPSQAAKPDQPAGPRGEDVYRKITGQDPPAAQTQTQTQAAPASGEEVLKRMTGRTLEEHAAGADSNTDQKGQEQVTAYKPSYWETTKSAFNRGVQDVADGLANRIQDVQSAINENIPLSKSIDQSLGIYLTPEEVKQRQQLRAQDAQVTDNANAENPGTYSAARVAGNAYGSSPILVPMGAAGGAIAESLPAGTLLQGGARVLSGAAQGAAGAGLAGEDPIAGAVAGGGLSTVALGGGNLLQGAGGKVGSYITKGITGGLSTILAHDPKLGVLQQILPLGGVGFIGYRLGELGKLLGPPIGRFGNMIYNEASRYGLPGVFAQQVSPSPYPEDTNPLQVQPQQQK